MPLVNDTFAERVAIVESNGHNHLWAETFGGLATMPRPATISPERWAQIVDDAGRFLDAWGKQAAALGWNPVECFHPVRGLVALIEGGRIIAITSDSCAIEHIAPKGKRMDLCRYVALAGENHPRWRVWSALTEPVERR